MLNGETKQLHFFQLVIREVIWKKWTAQNKGKGAHISSWSHPQLFFPGYWNLKFFSKKNEPAQLAVTLTRNTVKSEFDRIAEIPAPIDNYITLSFIYCLQIQCALLSFLCFFTYYSSTPINTHTNYTPLSQFNNFV